MPDNEPAHGWRNDRLNPAIRKERRQRLPQLLREPRILQDKCALDVGSAVQTAGQLKMPMADGARRLEQLQQFFAFQHSAQLTAGNS